MTIQKDATTQPVSQQQIRDENEAAALVNGSNTQQPQEGASDNLDASIPTHEFKPSTEDVVRAQHQKQAEDREAMMADIARQRRQTMRDEHDELDQDLSLDSGEDVQENVDQEKESGGAQDAQAAQDEQRTQSDSGPRFFTDGNGVEQCELLVNGVKRVVPADRVYAAAQKMEAGDEKLRQAHEARQRLEQERQEFERQKQSAQQFKQPSVDPDAEAKLRTQLRSSLERLVNEGDDSAMDDLVDTIVKGRTEAIPTYDPHQIAREAVTLQNQQAWDTALPQAAQMFDADPDFADVNGNEVLAAKATEYAKQLVTKYDARNRNVSPLAIMQEAALMARSEAQQLAQALGLTVPSHTQQVASRSEQVAARKTQAGNTVTGGGQGRVASQPTKAKDGGQNPSSRDAKVAAFAGLVASRTNPMIKR